MDLFTDFLTRVLTVTILGYVTHLIALVTAFLFLAAVTGIMSKTVTLVTLFYQENVHSFYTTETLFSKLSYPPMNRIYTIKCKI